MNNDQRAAETAKMLTNYFIDRITKELDGGDEGIADCFLGIGFLLSASEVVSKRLQEAENKEEVRKNLLNAVSIIHKSRDFVEEIRAGQTPSLVEDLINELKKG